MIPIYTFLAIFSKGAVGIMVPLMTIILFLLVKRELKSIGKYLGFKFWGVLVILCGAWFVGVYLDGGVEYLNNLLFHQTIDRAVNSFHHKEPFYYYLITYWYSIAPWSILAVLALVVGFKNKIIKSDTDKIFAIASLGTIVLMSCVSSKIVIYLLPAFPFLIFLSGKIIEQAKESGLLRIGVIIPALIFIVAFPLSFFADKFGLSGVELWAPLPLFTALMAVGGALSLVYLYKKDIVKGVYAISASLFITLFAAGFSMGSLNDMIGLKGACKYAESEQCRVKNEGGESLNYGYYEFKAGDNLDVYLGVVPKKISAEELQQLNNTIIFAKKRRIAKDSLLRASIEGMKREDFGNFAIVTIKR